MARCSVLSVFRRTKAPILPSLYPDEVRLTIKVVPGASKTAVSGWLGDVLKVRVTAPAERGKANRAVEALVAAALGIAVDRILIVAGHSSARKIVEIAGLDEAEVRQRLSTSVG